MADQDIEIKLNGNTTGFVSAIQKAKDDFKKATDSIAADSKKARTDLDSAFNALNIRTGDQILQEGAKIKAAFEVIKNSASSTASDVARATQAMKSKFQELGGELKGNTPHISALGEAFTGTAAKITASIAAVAGFAAVITQVKSTVQAGMGLEQTLNSLTAITGSVDTAKSKYNELKDTANQLGLSVKDIVPTFTSWMGSVKGTALEGAKAEGIFKSVSTAVAGLHLPTEQANRVFLAMSQMASKGVISMEELRQQLGEAMPGAINALAGKMGVSVAELSKMVESGKLLSADVLPQLAQALEETFGGAAANNINTLQGKWNLLNNKIEEFKQMIAESGIMDALKEHLDGVIDRFNKMADDGSLQEMARNIGTTIGAVIKIFSNLAEFIGKNIKEIAALVAAFAIFKTLSFAVGVIAELNAIYAAAILANGGVMALGKSLMLIAGAGVIGWQIGTLINNHIIKPFQDAYDKAGNVVAEVNKLKASLDKISGGSGLSKAFSGIDTALSNNLKAIDKQYADTTNTIIEADKKAATAFEQDMQRRVAAAQQASKENLNAQNAVAEKEKQLVAQKQQLTQQQRASDEASQQQAIKSEIAANSFKNSSLLEAEKKLDTEKQALANLSSQNLSKNALKSAQESAKARITADTQAVEELKRNAATVAAADKVANELRVAQFKKASDDIANREAQLKQQTEQLKQQQIINERALVTSSEQAWAKRAEQLQNLEFTITENAKSHARARATAEKDAITQRIQAIEEGTRKAQQATQDTLDAQVRKTLDAYQKQADAGRHWYETSADFEKRLGEEKNRVLKITEQLAKEATAKNIALAAEELRAKQDQLKQQEAAVKAYTEKVKELQNQLAGITKSFADEEFATNLRRMADGEKYSALQGKISSQIQEMQSIRQKIDSTEGADKEKLIKQLENLSKETRDYNRDLESLGKTGNDAIVTVEQSAKAYKTNLDLIKESTTGVIRSQIDAAEASKKMLDGSGGAVEQTKKGITELTAEIAKMKDSKIQIGLLIDGNGLAAVQAKIVELKNGIATPAKLTVEPETFAAQAAINQLKQPTSSQHTVYVTKVQTNADGGYIQKFAEGGFARASGMVTGAGTETSDDIPSMLSNGEFVVRAASVRKWGRGFFESLNSGITPNIPRFSTGGLVGSSSGSRNDTMNLNLTIGGSTFKLQSAREQAMGLASALQQLSRAA